MKRPSTSFRNFDPLKATEASPSSSPVIIAPIPPAKTSRRNRFSNLLFGRSTSNTPERILLNKQTQQAPEFDLMNPNLGRTSVITPAASTPPRLESAQSNQPNTQQDFSLVDIQKASPTKSVSSEQLSVPHSPVVDQSMNYQLRYILNGALFFVATLGAVIMIAGRNGLREQGSVTSQTVHSINFFLCMSFVSMIVSLASCIYYYWVAKGEKVWNVSSDISVARDDVLAHSVLTLFWLSTLIDVIFKQTQSVCISTGCPAVGGAIFFGVLAFLLTSALTVFKGLEARKNMAS
jgi:hypothetical protein